MQPRHEKTVIFPVVMFGFGYTMVPMYEKFCEVTGIYNLTKSDVLNKNVKVDMTRMYVACLGNLNRYNLMSKYILAN